MGTLIMISSEVICAKLFLDPFDAVPYLTSPKLVKWYHCSKVNRMRCLFFLTYYMLMSDVEYKV